MPAPAVVELLRGLPTGGGGSEQDGELTTPTGAALLAELVDEWPGLPAGRLVAVGAGAGGRERPGVANVLRALLVDQAEAPGTPLQDPHGGPVELLETTLDDATAEVLAYAADRLRSAGALDVWFTPALMKKGRPGHVLHALVRAAARGAVAEVMMRETTTFGVRVLPVERMVLDERREEVEAAGGHGARASRLPGRPPGDRLAGVRGLPPACGAVGPASQGGLRGRAGGGLWPLRSGLTRAALSLASVERLAHRAGVTLHTGSIRGVHRAIDPQFPPMYTASQASSETACGRSARGHGGSGL